MVSEEKGEDHEQRQGKAEHDRNQQQHIPALAQWHNQVEGFGFLMVFGAQRNGGGPDGVIGIGNFRPQQHKSQCGREQQVHICSACSTSCVLSCCLIGGDKFLQLCTCCNIVYTLQHLMPLGYTDT